jgi:hypothetical protein
VGDRSAAGAAALLAVGSLVGLLRDRGLDAEFAQVGAVGPRGVRLIGGDRVGAGAAAADRPAHPDPFQYCDELGAIGGQTSGEHERQRAAIVERFFAHLMQSRRLVRDFERSTGSAEAMVYWSMTTLMSRRLCPIASFASVNRPPKPGAVPSARSAPAITRT